ncbi:MAG: hypothetical protein HS111_17640 [Kofleriaceae bacterium]|nr:hypothetical protein [Kofleriaceae bacterium]
MQDDRLERYVRGRGFTTPVVGSGATHKWLSMRLDAIYTWGPRRGRARGRARRPPQRATCRHGPISPL